MLLNALFPTRDIGTDPAKIRDWAQAAEDLGYHGVEVADHVFGAAPRGDWKPTYSEHDPFHETFTTMAFIAAVTKTIKLCSGVLILPQRQAGLVAKQAAQVDVLTEGRLRLGLGIGWNTVEFEGLGMDFKNRARRFEEQIDLMRKLWCETSMSYQGRYHTINSAAICPLPVQRPIPIWIGGSAEAALRRTARLADGYFPQRPLDGGWPATLERMRGWAEEAGRDPAALGIEWRIGAGEGTPDDWRREADEWRGLGATHLAVTTMRGGLDVEGHIARMGEALEALS